MGVVYRAYDSRLQRTVAIKLVRVMAGDPASRQQLLREARAASALNHPHVCTIYEIGEVDGETFIVMEYVEGPSLRELTFAAGLSIQTALRYGIQIADAVAHAHERGIIHRDLKSGNVVITQTGRVKVLDFGLARRLTDPALEEATREDSSIADLGSAAGTLPYMAPELFCRAPADARSDIWALGVVLYEMMSGHPPFAGRSGYELSAAILREPTPALPPHVPIALQSVVARCLMKEPGERYQHAAEVRAALEAVQDFSSGRSAPEAPSSTAGPAMAVWLSRTLRWTAAALLTLVALTTVVVWRLTRDERDSLAMANRLISTFPGSSGAASFSPDGTMIAFQNDATGKSQIYVKTLAPGEPLQITAGEEAAERPVWSPKGDQILFQHRGGIWSVPPLGGPPRQIIAQGMNPNFALSGDEVVYEGLDPNGDDAIWIADVTGGHRRRVTQRPSPFPSDPALSPDGEFTAFFQSVDGPLVDLWVVPSTGGTPRRLTFDVVEAGRPIWTPDGRSIIFYSSRGGSQTLWRISADGGTPQPVTTGAGQDRDPAISADGRHLVYTNVRQSIALLIKDPSTGEQKEVLQRRASLFGPTFSPAGDRIAFSHQVVATVGAAAHLFTISVDGKDLRQITHAPDEQNLFPQWPGDETFLYFTRGRPGASFRKIPTIGGESAEVGQWVLQNWPRVDPFGRSVAYTRQNGGQDEAVVRSLETGREMVMELILNWIRWSRDGQTIVGTQTVRFGDRHSWNVVACAVRDGKCQVLTKGHDPVPSRDGARIFFLRPSTGGFYEFWVMKSDGSNAQSLGTLGPFSPSDVSFDVSPQDRVVFAQLREGTSELWRAELR